MVTQFLKRVKEFPDHDAIIIEEKRYTYRQLYNKAQSIALLVEKQNSESQLIGIYTDNNFYTYASILGVLICGKGFVPLNSKFPDKRLNNIIEQTELELVLACEDSISRIHSFSPGVSILNLNQTHEGTDNFVQSVFDSEEIAYILFTSGSTGEPKGIPISYSNFNHFLESLLKKYPLGIENKVLQCFELSFDVSIACTFLAFSSGATLVVSSLKGIIAVNAFKAILDYKVDFVSMAPSAITYMVNYKLIPQFQLPFVRTTLFTGEALPYQNVLKWKESAPNTIVDNAYGPTEVTVWSYFYTIDQNTQNELVNGLCPIGEPLSGVLAYICPLDDSNNEKRGELMLAGEHVFKGYWKNLSKTKEVFHEERGEVWYKTGDLVYKNDEGNVVYVNRLDNQVKINGYRIELGEIEYVLKEEINAGFVVVLVSKDGKGNDQLVAFTDKIVNAKEAQLTLANKLTFYMIPKEFKCIKELPLNTNGKIDRVTLSKML